MERIKLVAGAGHQLKKPGWVHLDIIPYPTIDVVHDLNVAPWPFEDGSVSEISATHVLEHLDDFCVFMEECWRLLHPGGDLYIEVPDAADPDLAWCDPTHKRPYRVHSFTNYCTHTGVEQFGYLKHAWSIMFIRTDGKVIRVHMMPLPLEAHSEELLWRIDHTD